MGIYERKQREKEQRKIGIINAARKVFSNKGFNTATIEEIAMEAELSPGTLYLYFKGKEELHTSLSIEILKHLADEIQKVVGQDISAEEKIKRFCDVFIDMYEYDSNILINLFHLQSGETLKNLSDEFLQQIKTHSTMAHGAMVDVIKEGIDQGIFIEEHPVVLADILWSSYAGVVLWVDSKRVLNSQKDFVKSTLKTAFKIILKGLKKK
ncbi:TetR/AcrR family transcriptional regulator [Desulfobacula sp.]|uniref:TetR/AcrR family transcriptional regulator n=1 Tax=Desulfobacula sp. TaxID=2593537 RepID=UPI002627E83D|nr:TetR/AcrR family transcriptional regulator [Desulfobacula sp.]